MTEQLKTTALRLLGIYRVPNGPVQTFATIRVISDLAETFGWDTIRANQGELIAILNH